MLYKSYYREIHLGSNGVEAAVITLYLLIFVGMAVHTLAKHNRNKPTRTPMTSPHADECLVPARSKLITERNVEEVIRSNSQDCDTAAVKRISIYSTPLSAPFESSKPGIRSYLQRQFSPVDYHAFIVIETSDGMWWALDKIREGVFVSWGRSRDSVLFHFNREPRATPVHWIAQDSSTVSIGRIVKYLKHVLPQNFYEPFKSNCQHFTKEIFDKFAERDTWKLTTPTDLTSPLTLFTDGGNPFYIMLYYTSFLYELYLLLNDGMGNDSFYYQFLVGISILVLPIIIYLTNKADEQTNDLVVGAMLIMLALVLIVEGIFYTPLGAVKRRGAQYVKIWRSGSIYTLWSPLSYTMVYVILTYIFLGFILFEAPVVLWKCLPTQITSSLSWFENICIWWKPFVIKITITAFPAFFFLCTVIYFYLQE